MEYEILQYNDDNTALVSMMIDGNSLNENFPVGDTPKDLETNILNGMAVFKASLGSSTPATDATNYQLLLNKTNTVTILPELPADIESV